jgi:hypothetical protein
LSQNANWHIYVPLQDSMFCDVGSFPRALHILEEPSYENRQLRRVAPGKMGDIDMLKHALMGMVATGLALACAPAANAEDFGAADMNIHLGPNGTITADFGNSGIVAGLFTDTFSFTIDDNGFGSGTISTGTNVLFSATDTDLLSVFVNGIAMDGLGVPAQFEFGSIAGVPIQFGVLNTIVINGFSRGNGGYGATATFTPAAVPEPATWAFMLLGFGAIGLAARHRARSTRLSFS